MKGTTLPAVVKPKRSRKWAAPNAEFNRDVFEGLCRIQCTLVEVAAVMGRNERWITAQVGAHYHLTFSEAFDKFSAGGRASLRRTQFEMAKTNPAMAIFLGKNLLGQTDRQEVSGPQGSPLVPIDVVRVALDRLCPNNAAGHGKNTA